MEKKTTDRAVEDGVIVGRNPVLEALSAGRELECVYLQTGERRGTLARIAALARDHGVPVKDVAVQKLDALSGATPHQGAAAILSAAPYAEVEDIFAHAGGRAPFVILCDGIEDPHNLGAIIRTAEAAGADGVIIPKRRSAGLTAAAVKASAGAAEHLPVARVTSLVAVIEELKKKGLWIYCADMDGQRWDKVDYAGGVGLVVGAEGEGVGRLVKEKCDVVVSLPMLGRIGSLNASVAAGIVMYEVARQRLDAAAKEQR